MTTKEVLTTITSDEPAPGLKTILSFRVPDQRSGKVELQYQHEYAGISTSIGLTATPLVNFSGVVGNNGLSVGTDLSFDTATDNFTKLNGGLSFTNSDLIASLTLHGSKPLKRVLHQLDKFPTSTNYICKRVRGRTRKEGSGV